MREGFGGLCPQSFSRAVPRSSSGLTQPQKALAWEDPSLPLNLFHWEPSCLCEGSFQSTRDRMVASERELAGQGESRIKTQEQSWAPNSESHNQPTGVKSWNRFPGSTDTVREAFTSTVTYFSPPEYHWRQPSSCPWLLTRKEMLEERLVQDDPGQTPGTWRSDQISRSFPAFAAALYLPESEGQGDRRCSQ